MSIFKSTSYHLTTCKDVSQVPDWIDSNLKKFKGFCRFEDSKLLSLNPEITFAFNTRDSVLQIDEPLYEFVSKSKV